MTRIHKIRTPAIKTMIILQKTALLLSSFCIAGWSSAALAGHWNTLANEPQALTSSASGQLNGIIYLAGGFDSSTNPHSTLQAYNPTKNTWATLASMPDSLANAVGGVINGRLYIAGGQHVGLDPVSTLYVYDPLSNTWTQKASMPQPGSNGVGGVIDSKLYVQSACIRIGHCDTRAFDVYDPATDTWTVLANRPNGSTANGSSAVINGKLYTVVYLGGSDTDSEVYDPANNTWAAFAKMPTAVTSASGAELDGKLYVFGGNPSSTTIVQAYDPIKNHWKIFSPAMSVGVAAQTPAQVDYGIAFVIGGYSGTNEDLILAPSIP